MGQPVQCRCCGETHDIEEMDFGFRRPDAWVDLTEPERPARSVFNDEAGIIDGNRFFIRGVLYVPVAGRQNQFGWGVWGEVSEETYERCRELFRDENQHQAPRFPAQLANRLPGYPSTLGLPMAMQLVSPDLRPVFYLETNEHALDTDIRKGIPAERLLEILEPYIH